MVMPPHESKHPGLLILVFRFYEWHANAFGFKKFFLAAFAVCFPLMVFWIEGAEGGLSWFWSGWQRLAVWVVSYLICLSGMMVVLATKKRMVVCGLVLCVLAAAAFKWETGWGVRECRQGSAMFGNYGEVDCSKQWDSISSRAGPWARTLPNFRAMFGFYFGVFKGPFLEMTEQVPLKVIFIYVMTFAIWVHVLRIRISAPPHRADWDVWRKKNRLL